MSKKYEEVKAAIDALFSDTSQPVEQTIDELEMVIEEARSCIDCLRSDK